MTKNIHGHISTVFSRNWNARRPVPSIGDAVYVPNTAMNPTFRKYRVLDVHWFLASKLNAVDLVKLLVEEEEILE